MYLEMFKEKAQLQGLRILVLEKEPDHQDLLSFILEVEGASVISVTTVKEAKEVLSNQSIDVVFASVRTLKKEPLLTLTTQLAANKRILAIAVAETQRDSYNSSRLRELGYQGYICKPLNPSEVINSVAIYTGRQRADYHVRRYNEMLAVG
jgi:DNA-binding response OmpR family regulator